MVSSKTLRVRFEKTGKLRYISHLDLLRTMQTALRRAGVKMVYSEGFNPHMKINFALPLSIGTESVCEFMDLKTDISVDPEYVKRELGKNLPTDMKILEVYEPQSKFTDIKYSAYTVWLDYGEKSKQATEVCKKLFSSPLVVTKKTKKGEREVDITPMIRSIECKYEFGCVIIMTELCADSENYLNPSYLTSAVEKEMGGEPENKKVLRTRALFESGETFK